ncbi:MAG: hypothetical protein GXP48_09720 [Acidobacteria bacterium]|nr:hypothetical protein [Acidobacteriota bacterium]
MKIVILTARPELETNARLAGAARERGLSVGIVDALGPAAGCGPYQLRSPRGEDLLDPPPDAVLPRIGNWRPESLLAMLEVLTASGVATPNPPVSIRTGRDHWRTMMAVSGAGLPVPCTLAGAGDVGRRGCAGARFSRRCQAAALAHGRRRHSL